MNRNITQRDQRQLQIKQTAEIQTLKQQLKVMKENYQRCIKEKQQIQSINLHLLQEIKQKQTFQQKTKQKLKLEIQNKYKDKIREAELKTIRMQEECQKEIEKLENKFQQDLSKQFEREEELNQVIKKKQDKIFTLNQQIFRLQQKLEKQKVKNEELAFMNHQYQAINRGLRQENSLLSIEIRKFSSQIQLLNLQLTKLQDKIAQHEIQKRQAEQETLNKDNQLQYVSLIADQNNQVKHMLLDENTSLLNVANVINRGLYESRRDQFQLRRQLVQRSEQLNRTNIKMDCLKKEVSLLPHHF